MRNNMKLKLTSLLLGSILVGCGSDSSSENTKPETNNDKIAEYFNVDSRLIDNICSDKQEFTCTYETFSHGDKDAMITSKHFGYIQRIDSGDYYSELSANLNNPNFVVDNNETLVINYSSNDVENHEHHVNNFTIKSNNDTHKFIISELMSYDVDIDGTKVDKTYLPLLEDLSHDFSHNGVRVVFNPDGNPISVYNDEVSIQSYFELLKLKVEENV
ncbi:hypothetical protein GNP73_16715 [Aliivibrio fischeri]|uniref:hypothetical protein n=1 Tax=Aliivibrio fischeri TaxID=668 RepID=UPI0012DA073B|nr:hypothetical protein [Aliivibrio fischeri]MUJ29610.1 hypothetical protein [Aliivibrio fischeri]